MVATLYESNLNNGFSRTTKGKKVVRSNSSQFKCRPGDGYEMNQINNNNNEAEYEIYKKQQNNYKAQLGKLSRVLYLWDNL